MAIDDVRQFVSRPKPYRCLVVLVFLGIPGFSWAQTNDVVIRVLDARSSERLDLATVLIQPGDFSGVTDSGGRIEFDMESGIYRITANYLGFEEGTLEVSVENDTIILLPLIYEATGLQTIEVTGTDASETLRRPVMGVQKITQKQLGKLPTVMGEVDILKGLQLLPGVTSAGEASNGISVRGGSIDQNLVLLEHAPIFNPTHAKPAPAAPLVTISQEDSMCHKVSICSHGKIPKVPTCFPVQVIPSV